MLKRLNDDGAVDGAPAGARPVDPAEIRGEYDIAVVGAGPAGLAAASLCARSGLATVLFDDQPSPGGQIYRAVGETPVKDRSILGPDYWHGARLVAEFLASGAQYVPGATVSGVTRGLDLVLTLGRESISTSAASVVLATGALERPVPIPGGTLPEVMTAGAAQALLKRSGVVPGGRTVLAGTGPLLWLVAWQYLNAGVAIDAILDTAPHGNRARAWPHVLGFLCSPYFGRGLQMWLAVRRRVPVFPGVTELRAEGAAKVESVSFRSAEGAVRTLPVDTLLLHEGVVPNVSLARAAGVELRWDDTQLSWRPVVDANGGTSVPGILIAGDGAGIAGGQAAAWRGVLAATAIVNAIRPGRKLPVDKLARTALAQFGRGRKFLDALYRPARDREAGD